MLVLELDPLARAVAQLETGLARALGAPDDELLRDGVIQRFEYTVDLSWKLIQRHLKHVAQVDDAAIRTKKDIFREAARLKLVADAEAWIGYYESRNEASHIYNPDVAAAVFDAARRLPADARALLSALTDAT